MHNFLNLEENQKILDLLCKSNCDTNLLSMKGIVRTKEECPVCRGKFAYLGDKLGYICLSCKTTPKKFYIDLCNKGRSRIYSDQLGKGFSSFDHAKRTLETIRHQIDGHSFDIEKYKGKDQNLFKFNNYADRWLKIYEERALKDKISKGYFNDLKSYFKRFIIPQFKDLDIREIRKPHIQEFEFSLPQFAPKTIKNIMDVLKKLFKDAYEDRDITEIPKFSKIDVPDANWAWVDEKTQDFILSKVPKFDYPIFLFLSRQGCRPGEARALKWDAVDLINETATLRRTFSTGYLREFTKTKKIRIIPLNEEVMECLKCLPIPISKDQFVFKNKEGRPYSKTNLHTIWKHALKEAGYDNLRLYDWSRHSVASQAVNRGVPINLIQQALGHTNSNTTKKYAHILTNTLKQVFRAKCPQSVPESNSNNSNLLKIKRNS